MVVEFTGAVEIQVGLSLFSGDENLSEILKLEWNDLVFGPE